MLHKCLGICFEQGSHGAKQLCLRADKADRSHNCPSSTVSGTASNPVPYLDNKLPAWFSARVSRNSWVYWCWWTSVLESRTSEPQVGWMLAASGHTTPASIPGIMQQTKEDVIRLLGLIPHADYGFFSETYRSGASPMTSRGRTDLTGDVFPATSIQGPSGSFWQGKGEAAGASGLHRNIMTSIFFMVTSGALDQPLQAAVRLAEACCAQLLADRPLHCSTHHCV